MGDGRNPELNAYLRCSLNFRNLNILAQYIMEKYGLGFNT
jgi:hypothetical protein